MNTAEVEVEVDAVERIDLLLRDLRSSRSGLSSREAQRRLTQYGPNELRRRGGRRWPSELARQFTHPLALLLWGAAALAWVAGIPSVAVAIIVVIVAEALALALPFPFIVWGSDELHRWWLRRRDSASRAPARA